MQKILLLEDDHDRNFLYHWFGSSGTDSFSGVQSDGWVSSGEDVLVPENGLYDLPGASGNSCFCTARLADTGDHVPAGCEAECGSEAAWDRFIKKGRMPGEVVMILRAFPFGGNIIPFFYGRKEVKEHRKFPQI